MQGRAGQGRKSKPSVTLCMYYTVLEVSSVKLHAPAQTYKRTWAYTLHLTPYTLHLTPYTLHLTPYTLHLTPYTLHLTPYTLHLTAYTLHLTPYILGRRPTATGTIAGTCRYPCLANVLR